MPSQQIYEKGGLIFVPPAGVTHDLTDWNIWDSMHKFGGNSMVSGPADLWDGASITPLHPGIVAPGVATIESDDANDGGGGTGLTSIRCQMLDEDWNQVNVDAVATDGIAVVDVQAAPNFIACYRLIGGSAGGLDTNAGNIIFRIDGVETARIIPGTGSTLMAWFPVPLGKTFYLLSWYVTIGNKQNATAQARLYVRPFGGIPLTKRQDSAHTSAPIRYYWDPLPEAVPERSVIWVRIESVSTAMEVNGGFTGVILDNLPE